MRGIFTVPLNRPVGRTLQTNEKSAVRGGNLSVVRRLRPTGVWVRPIVDAQHGFVDEKVREAQSAVG